MTDDRVFYVYEHWRPDRGECFYVGKGRGSRANSMSTRNAHHKAIQAKLARLGFAVEVRIVEGSLNEQAAFDLERARIALWRADGADLANRTDGGEGQCGRSPSAEQRAKLSVANKGAKRSGETRARMSAASKGRVISKETRAKISAANKGKTAVFKGKKHTSETRAVLSEIGKKRGAPRHSPETIERIANAHRGRKRPAETCAKISAALAGRPARNKGAPSPLRGRVLTEETRAKMSAAKTAYWATKRQEGAE